MASVCKGLSVEEVANLAAHHGVDGSADGVLQFVRDCQDATLSQVAAWRISARGSRCAWFTDQESEARLYAAQGYDVTPLFEPREQVPARRGRESGDDRVGLW